MKSFLFFIVVFTTYLNVLLGQGIETLPKSLSPEQVILILKKYHPIIRQANLEYTISENDILNARASFDPTLHGYLGNKKLKSDEYYNDKELGITIPTWYGIDVEGGISNISGNRLNNSETVGDVSYIGVQIPLLKNLVYDKRRGQLEQSKIFNKISLQEQAKIINDITLEAIKAYWNWVKAYEVYLILDGLVRTNQSRLEFVKKSVSHGERPSIDTIEAKTQLIQFEIEKNNQWTEFLNAGNELSIYLWKENQQPYQLSSDILPTRNWDKNFKSPSLHLSYEKILMDGLKFHPEIKMYEEKINIYTIQKKIYFQDLLPKLDLNYRVLSNSVFPSIKTDESFPLSNNFQYGVKLSIPLRLSEGRSNFKTAKMKLNIASLDLDQKVQQVSVKIKSYFNHYLNYDNLVSLQYGNYQNYALLVKAEESRFQNGESNLFTINARENKALEALEKLIEYKTKYLKSIYELQWSAGLLR